MSKKKDTASEATPVEVGKLTTSENIEWALGRDRVSIYTPLVALCAKMTQEGHAFTMPIPKGVSVDSYMSRIASALKIRAAKPPAGMTFRRALTKDGKHIGVELVKARKPRRKSASA